MATKILAIDDENDVLLIIKSGLQSEGFEVVTAMNGIDGLAVAEEEKPDLVLLDIMMPEMDGIEVLRELKNRDSTAQIPVIMLTALSDRRKIKEALDAGTSYYIVKPFELSQLTAKVHAALKEDSEL